MLTVVLIDLFGGLWNKFICIQVIKNHLPKKTRPSAYKTRKMRKTPLIRYLGFIFQDRESILLTTQKDPTDQVLQSAVGLSENTKSGLGSLMVHGLNVKSSL